ncbi:MAG: beta-propeller domain-containing protein [Thermoplasmata archaeon]|nr:beta-propeller domain-containing protein [Thermoplasmata archaeon]
MKNEIIAMIVIACVFVSGIIISASSQGDVDNPKNIIIPSGEGANTDHIPITFSSWESQDVDDDGDDIPGLDRFGSFQDIVDYLDIDLNASTGYGYPTYYRFENQNMMVDEGASIGSPSLSFSFDDADGSSKLGGDYSSTNVQVDGVDEGDIVKTDGNYAYIVSSDRSTLMIIDVRPAEEMKIITRIKMDSSIVDIYLVGDKLVMIGQSYFFEGGLYRSSYQYSNQPVIDIQVLELNDRVNVTQARNETLKGHYHTSRIIDDHLYLVSTISGYTLRAEKELPIPANRTYCIENDEVSQQFTSFMSMNIEDNTTESKVATILMSTASNIYVSSGNIYITHMDYGNHDDWVWNDGRRTQATVIHKLSLDGDTISYVTSGKVPGYLLNRYSMDEFGGYFRVATTTNWGSSNQVYVLDYDLEIVGSIEDIAPGERIYSARFVGEKAYLVTFRQVDPFFVIDLSDPEDPEILGELKIPGYSDYLHPYDENHIIGIGKDGRSVKVSLFDVTDVENPKELDTMMIGDWGSDSKALYDTHAFLFSRERNMLVMPMYVYGNYNSYYGQDNWAGAYVFDISPENGITLKAEISHEVEMEDDVYMPYNYYNYFEQADRSFYIDDVLFTVSYQMLKATSLDDYDHIKTINLD